MDYTATIATASIILNGIFAWLWYRRKEIMLVVKEAREAYKDDKVSEDEFWKVMDKLELVMEKK